MEPTTLRLSEELRDALDAEANDAGFSSRSDYIRYLLKNRDVIHRDQSSGIDPTTTATELEDIDDQITAITDQLTSLEHRVEELEQTGTNSRHGQRQQQDESTSASNQNDTTANAGVLVPPVEEPPQDDDNRDAESKGTFDALELYLEEKFPESKAPREVLLDAARLLDSQGDLSASELREQLYERHSEAYNSAEVLWTATIHRHYEDIPGFKKPEYGTYRFSTEESG